MNTKLIIWVVGIFFGAIVAGVLWYVMFAPKAAPQTLQPPVTLPTGNSITPVTSPGTTPSPATQTMTVAVQGGGTIVVNDFIHNGVTIPDTANSGRYLLAGNLGYCLSDPQKCQAGSAENFNVYYDGTPQTFSVDLTMEPIGQARLDMENFLLATLGITQQQMCGLTYYVGVTLNVNSRFAGKNLGFSFCPGATVLPK